MYNTKPNNKQINLIYKYCILKYTKDEILDRILFNALSEKNPILIEDVEKILDNFNRTIKYKLDPNFENIVRPNKTYILEDICNQTDLKKYSFYVNLLNIPRVDTAQNIVKKYKKNINEIIW